MSTQDDVRRVASSGKVTKDRRFDARDWSKIADFVLDTLTQRKKAREDREKLWDEIDRQVAMKPELSHKLNADGSPNKDKAWMPEIELPLQAETLEILTADARRMMFPTSGTWHAPHAALTDAYLDRVDLSALIAGDENELPSLINQDNADKLVEGTIDHWHRQYDFFGHIDKINAEAFKYGMGMGRARLVRKNVFLTQAKGVTKLTQQIPVLVPVSIRNTFPDDGAHRLMNEGHMVGGSVVREWHQLLVDVHLAAERGSTDPNRPDGGWRRDQLAGVDADKDGTVRLIEMEGDFVVPRATTDNFFIPNAVATVLVGKTGGKKKTTITRVVRFRFNQHSFNSYIEFPYHYEEVDNAYAASPLMKGHPIQKAATSALMRLIEAAALNTQPPVSYDREDQEFASTGGPLVFPGAQWGSISQVIPHQIGEPQALFAVYQGLLQQYSDVTGITAPRLGQQTVSHTTAFAKEAELNRGVIRTVDYVRSTLKGPMTEWLSKAYEMGRGALNQTTLYIDAYNGFVDIDKSALPDTVVFEVFGAGAPAEEAQKQVERERSLQLALQVEVANVNAGGQPRIDLNKMIEQILRNGGWQDVDSFLRVEAQVQGAQPQPQTQPGIPGVVSEALDGG